MVVSILGCGWYGEALATALVQKGLTVKGSVTSDNKLEHLREIGVQPFIVKLGMEDGEIDLRFFDCDILVVSIPPKLKSGEGAGYLEKIRRVISTCVQQRVAKVIYISSTGVYGEHNKEVNELDDPLPDSPSGMILLDAEKLFRTENVFKTTILRFGGLVGPGRHPGRFFAGKTNIPNGMALVNLIHQADCVAISLAIIEQDAFGCLFNACSPDHPPKGAFYSTMASKANLPVPQFLNELKSWKIVSSIKLKNVLNYTFIFSDWIAQAAHI